MRFSIQLSLIATLTAHFCNAANLPRATAADHNGVCTGGPYEASCTDETSLMQRGVDLRMKKHHTFTEGDNASMGMALEAESNGVSHSSSNSHAESRAQKEATCIETYRSGLNKVRAGLGHNLQASSFQVPKVSKKPFIVGAGVGSTGTRSILSALRLLGKKVWHCYDHHCDIPAVTSIMAPDDYMGLFDTKHREMMAHETKECLHQLSRFDYTNVSNFYDGILDTPMAEVFLYMWRSFPNAKVILTERNATKWVSNRIAEHGNTGFLPMQNPCGLFMQYPTASKLSYQDLEQLYNMHSDFVQCIVPENQLLRINLFEMDDDQQKGLMAKMANFLNISLPESMLHMDFPHKTGFNGGSQ